MGLAMANIERLVRGFVDGLDLHSVFVAASSPDGPVRIGRTKSVAGVISRVRTKSYNAAAITAILWCTRDSDARRIVDSCRAQLAAEGRQVAGGWLAIVPLNALNRDRRG